MPEHVAISTRQRARTSSKLVRTSAMAKFLDPIYIQCGTFGRKSDVYSWGMCLLWILTGTGKLRE